MDIGPLCDAAKPLGHSWPGPHWWMTLSAADQGAWASGIGTLVAAAVALLIASAESFRRRREATLRARIVLAGIATPLTGLFAMVEGIEASAAIVASAMPGEAVRRVDKSVSKLKHACYVLRPILAVEIPPDAIYLRGHMGPALAAAWKDADLLCRLVTDATDIYLQASEKGDFERMQRVAAHLKAAPSLARAIKKRLVPVTKECQRVLGSMDDVDF